MKNGLLRILNDLDSAGRGGRREEEEGGTRRNEGREGVTGRKEGPGGRRNEESEKMRKSFKAYSLTIQNPPKIFLCVGMVSGPPGMCPETLTDPIL